MRILNNSKGEGVGGITSGSSINGGGEGDINSSPAVAATDSWETMIGSTDNV